MLGGGLTPGEVVLLGGKRGVGKTIASLQWDRSVAPAKGVAVFVCFEHDETTLLARLLLCELGELVDDAPEGSPPDDDALRARILDVAAGSLTLRDAIGAHPLLAEAQRRLATYADRLILVAGAGGRTTVAAIGEITRTYVTEAVASFIDYVQKVPTEPHDLAGPERTGHVIEALKQLALDQDLAVVAVAAADHVGLAARRIQTKHLRGSTAFAYEADVVILLNDKQAVVGHVPPRPGGPTDVVFSSRRTAAARPMSTPSSPPTSPTIDSVPVATASKVNSGPTARPTSESRVCSFLQFRTNDPCLRPWPSGQASTHGSRWPYPRTRT